VFVTILSNFFLGVGTQNEKWQNVSQFVGESCEQISEWARIS
jgi:hypothetical protein